MPVIIVWIPNLLGWDSFSLIVALVVGSLAFVFIYALFEGDRLEVKEDAPVSQPGNSRDASPMGLTTMGMLAVGRLRDESQGQISEVQFSHIVKLVSLYFKDRKSGKEITDMLAEQLKMLSKSNEETLRVLFEGGKNLSMEIKQEMLIACIAIGLIEGELNDRQNKLIDDISLWLGLSNAQKPMIIELAKQRVGWTEERNDGGEKTKDDLRQAQALGIKLAIVVAMTNGALEDEEGNTIKAWVQKNLKSVSVDHQKERKQLYNTAMKEAYADAISGKLSLSQLLASLNRIASKPVKLEIIELCFAVMAADEIPKQVELDAIKRITEGLNLDYEEILKIHEPTISGKLNWANPASGTIESYLGIQPEWSIDRKKQLLGQAYHERVHRLNTVPEGPQRKQIQHELDRIGKARASL